MQFQKTDRENESLTRSVAKEWQGRRRGERSIDAAAAVVTRMEVELVVGSREVECSAIGDKVAGTYFAVGQQICVVVVVVAVEVVRSEDIFPAVVGAEVEMKIRQRKAVLKVPDFR